MTDTIVSRLTVLLIVALLIMSAASSAARQAHAAELHPLNLAAADFDGDGVQDLLAGYATGTGGLLTIYRGNADAMFAPLERASAIRPLMPEPRSYAAPIAPLHLGAGDFDGDGAADVVLAEAGATALMLLAGDGRGGLGAASTIRLGGSVTALLVGDVNRRDELPDIAVAVAGAAGAELLVFESPFGALKAEPERIVLPAPATDLALGQIDDLYAIDLAVAAGSEVLVIHGRDRQLAFDPMQRKASAAPVITRYSMGGEVRALAAGFFRDERREDLAVLTADGALQLLGRDPLKQAPEQLAALPGAGRVELVVGRITGHPREELVALDVEAQALHSVRPGTAAQAPRMVSVDAAGAVALLPLRINLDALHDIVTLRTGEREPHIALSAPTATFVVNSTGDGTDSNTADGVCNNGSGACTLRAAIQQANASAGADSITFSIGSSTVIPRIIRPASYLPEITDPVTINGSGNSYAIVLDGSQAGHTTGIWIDAGSTTIHRLVINGFSRDAIYMSTNGGNVITGNTIGADVSATTAISNDTGVAAFGISSNTIGGTTAAARNIISGNANSGISLSNITNTSIRGNYIGTNGAGSGRLGNTSSGIYLYQSTNISIGSNASATARNVISGNQNGIDIQTSSEGNATGTLIYGNFIGTNAAGTAAISNTYGIHLQGVGTVTIGGPSMYAGNLISGNADRGISLQGLNVSTIIQSNFIGTNGAGTAAVGNAYGVRVVGGSNTTIGGSATGQGNLISGNIWGLQIQNSSTTGTTVQGNLIGINAAGTALLGNTSYGLGLFGTQNSLIGGTSSGAGNVISGNGGDGLVVGGGSGTTIQGNLIGTDRQGTLSLGNGGHGIHYNKGWLTAVGGTGAGQANTIAFNAGNGIAVSNESVIALRGNRIFSNGGPGIDLGVDGVTPNDPTDTDIGPNDLQNFPILTEATISEGAVLLRGTLNSTPNRTFHVDFYVNASCNSSGYGEGEVYLGAVTITTDASGNANIVKHFDMPSNAGSTFAATASTEDGATSEFSPCFGTRGGGVFLPLLQH